jgi:hypothetical protein
MSPLISHASHPAHVVSASHVGLHMLYRAVPLLAALYTLGRNSLAFRMPYRKTDLPLTDESNSAGPAVVCQSTSQQDRLSHQGRKSRAGVVEPSDSQDLNGTKH